MQAFEDRSANPTERGKPKQAGGYDGYAFDSSYLVCLYWAISLSLELQTLGASIISQRVHIHYYYGISSQKTIPTMVLGP